MIFCEKCGASVEEGVKFCPSCGAQMSVAGADPVVEPVAGNNYQSPVNGQTPAPVELKSKLVGGLLGIFLGVFGIHNFYLGYTKKAIIQAAIGGVGVLTSCIGIGVFLMLGASIWGLVEGIMILAGNINVDGMGNPLKE